MSEHYPASHHLFRTDTENHQMATLHDDGLYRHLLFRNPKSNHAWFEVVTFPNTLVVNGDMGTFTFSRLDDMFTFFSTGKDINPHYWGQKLLGEPPYTQFSPHVFTSHVTEAYDDVKDDFDEEGQAAFWHAIENDILTYTDDERGARSALDGFEFRTIEFTDTWEWDCTEYTLPFLWNLHAIRHAITSYRQNTHPGADRDPNTTSPADLLRLAHTPVHELATPHL